MAASRVSFSIPLSSGSVAGATAREADTRPPPRGSGGGLRRYLGLRAIELDDEIIEIKQWDVIRVAPQVARGFEAGPEGLEIIAAGGSKPEGGDGELVENHWPDE